MDLCLYPCRKGSGNNAVEKEWLDGGRNLDYKPAVFGISQLSLDRNYHLFRQIEGYADDHERIVVPAYQFPPNAQFKYYHDEGLLTTDRSVYGHRLTFAWGRDMKKIVPSDDESPWNRAILAFIKAMPDDSIYILWWH